MSTAQEIIQAGVVAMSNIQYAGTATEKSDKVKIVHARDLEPWTRFPSYADHPGLTLGEYRKQRESGSSMHPVLFVSHRWEALRHPDPEGVQLAKLKALEDCFLIYDYASFPQDTSAPEDAAILRDILSGMNTLISNVIVLAAPDFLERGWCIYEYIVASMRACIVCDELNHDRFVKLRNLAATREPISLRLSGGSLESMIQNSKNQLILETVNSLLPLFARSKFAVAEDRELVRNLLVSDLMQMLPSKQEYMPYLGEWKGISWKEAELRSAFTSALQWEPMQIARGFRPYSQKVPSTIVEAVTNAYRLDRMPMQDESTAERLTGQSPYAGLGSAIEAVSGAFERVALIILAVIAGAIAVLLLVICLVIWWIFFR
jgi:hypothetical protein